MQTRNNLLIESFCDSLILDSDYLIRDFRIIEKIEEGLIQLEKCSMKIVVRISDWGRESVKVNAESLTLSGTQMISLSDECTYEQLIRDWGKKIIMIKNLIIQSICLADYLFVCNFSPASSFLREEIQTFLFAKPILLAAEAKQQSENKVIEMLEMTIDFMESIRHRPRCNRSIVYLIFMQFLKYELVSDGKERIIIMRYLRKLISELIKRRRQDENLPYNPMLPYQRWVQSQQPETELKKLINNQYVQSCTLQETILGMFPNFNEE